MTENLNYGITLDPSYQPQTDNCINEKYCSPQDLSCTKYGGFYQWNELMKYGSTSLNQGLCPPEWHVPSEAEWQSMIDNLVFGITAPQANALAGGTLKDPLVGTGFNALLSGLYYNNYLWSFHSGLNTGTIYWTSTPSGSHSAISRGLNVFTPSVSKYVSSTGNAFPLRCIRD
jgi:uncharacterized protein (TIGR02145 family)